MKARIVRENILQEINSENVVIGDIVDLESGSKVPADLRLIDMGNEEIKKAKKVLDELSQNEHERRLAELREKYIMDQKATEAAGYDKGLADAKIQIAKEMKSQGYDNNTIQKLTGLSIKEIEDL